MNKALRKLLVLVLAIVVSASAIITGYSIYDGDTRITGAVLFRFSEVEKRVIDENTYKVLVNLEVLDGNGNDLELKPGMPSPVNGKEYLRVYMNLIEVPAGYSVSEVKVNGTALTKTTNSNPATGEYLLDYDGNGLSLQSKTAGLIEVTVTKNA